MDPMNMSNIPMSQMMNQIPPMYNNNDSQTSSNDSPTPSSPIEETDKKEKKAGRRKINIEFIGDKSRRHITFSKRKSGIMKKAYELSTLTGTQVLLLVASETGHVYTFATPKLQPLITKQEGKTLIQACLNTPDTPPQPSTGSGSSSSSTPVKSEGAPNSTNSTPREVVDEKKSINNRGSSSQAQAVQQQQQQQQQAAAQIQQQQQQQAIQQAQAIEMQQVKYQTSQQIQSLTQGIPEPYNYPTSATGNNNNILYSTNIQLPQPNRLGVNPNNLQQMQQIQLNNLIPPQSNFPTFSSISGSQPASGNTTTTTTTSSASNNIYNYSSPHPFSRPYSNSQINSPNLLSTSSPQNNNTTPPQIIKHDDI